ncbi:hypothetical protein AMS68_002735 [Peltaster fructicola]|uniref:Major facilitator superfamily (MFS) profile domain-containing protein n=1 Tax=Peltaster fructicola TaxID=286661 RepID=A0A6H0XRE9_9PEZI|nr:hypothetical protein AMS68_002735 [Peltaster fructicola]
MDTSIVATSVFTIAIEFNSLASTIWVVLAYTLADLSFAVIFARLSDFIGRRFAVLASFTIFIAFSIGGGFSKTIDQLIVCRTLQGVGGAGLYALALIIVVEVSTPQMVAYVSMMIGAAIAVAGVLGPLIGGLFTNYVTWRWIFWVNAPPGALAALLFFIAWPQSSTEYKLLSFAQFDYIGSLLILAACVHFVFGLQTGGTGAYPWSSSIVVATIAVGCVCWILLFAWEYFVHRQQSKKPTAAIFPFHILKSRVMVAGILFTMLTGFILLLVVFSIPLRYQIVNLKDPAQAGILLLPLLASLAFGSFVGGAVSSKRNNTFQTFVVAAAFMMLGCGLLSTLASGIDVETKEYGFQILLGFGVGLTFSNISLMTSLESNQDDHAVTQGIIAQARVLGGSIGVAASNALFNSYARSQLAGVLTPAQISDLQLSTASVQTLNAQQAQAVRETYASSFGESLRICLYLAVVCLVLSGFTWQRHPPDIGKLMADIADRDARKAESAAA